MSEHFDTASPLSAMPRRPLKVFLSYASQDKSLVRELSRRLVGEGWIDTWLDVKKLLPGQDWRLKIEEAVETADIVIICLSSNSVTKEGYVQKELRYAREIALEKPEETIFLIPLRLNECEVPRGLRFYQWVDYFGENKDTSYGALVESLKLRYDQKLKLEDADRARKEELERELEEKFALEKIEREAAEKLALEEAARQQAKKDAEEKAIRGAAAKAKRERDERQAARKDALAKTITNLLSILKLTPSKSKPILRSIVIIGIIAILFWFGSWGIPKLALLMPIGQASLTPTFLPSTRITFTVSPQPPTKTSITTPPATETQIPAVTATLQGEVTDASGVQMALVSAGYFTMGSDYGREDSKPPHDVYLDSFYIDEYEVTNGLYRICQEAGGCQPPKNIGSRTHSLYYGYSQFDNFPVVNVDWFMANTYCQWRGARLPTEAEWEKAARGTDGREYAWGNMKTGYEVMCDKANYRPCHGDTRPVGSYETGKSIYNLYDMTGNVAEWVSSINSAYPYVADDGRENMNQIDLRITRGGSFDFSSFEIRVYDRLARAPDNIYDSVGFRCAKDVP